MTHTSKIDYNALAAQPVALLLSGGVDSSVVLHELVSHGVKPDCFYIKIGPEEQSEWNCNSEEDVEMATAVARNRRLPPRILEPGDALHHGKGARWLHAQP